MKSTELIPLPSAQATSTALVNEDWKDCAGFEGIYQVSNLGRVRSLDRVVKDSRHGQSRRKGIMRKLSPDTHGYLTVALTDGDGKWTKLVHSLVARAFVGERPDGYEVNHEDGNKRNNVATNLAYATPKQNSQHAHATGLCHPAKGSRNGSAKLSETDVLEIRAVYARGNTHQAVIAQRYGVKQAIISKIILRRVWKHLVAA